MIGTLQSISIKFILLTSFLLGALDAVGQASIFPFVENGKIGYRDTSGHVRMEPRFDYVEEFRAGLPWTIVGVGEFDILNHNMDRRKVNFTGKFGLIDTNGQMIFNPLFSIILQLDPEYAMVGQGSGYLHFENFPEEKNHVFEGELGIVSFKGDTLVPIRYQSLQSLVASGEKPIWYAEDQSNSYLFTGEQVFYLPNAIETIDPYTEGLARIKIHGDYGFIDTTGRMIIPPRFEKASQFHDNKAWVKEKDDYFYINEKGQKLDVSTFHFDEVETFSEGYARVKIFNEYAFIYPDSTFLIRPKFQEAGSFFNGITYVSSLDSFGYVHKNSKLDWVLKYERNPILLEQVQRNIPDTLNSFPGIPCNSNDTTRFRISFDSLHLSNFILIHLETMRWAPYIYYRYPHMLPSVIAGEGTLAGRHEFNFSFITPGNQAWEKFKLEVLFPILKNSTLRTIAWQWLRPIYKEAFRTMPEKHQEIYVEMIGYLADYFTNYSSEKVLIFLEKNADQFAHQHWDGSHSSYRKVSALLERLVFIHGILEIQEVQDWTAKINQEIKSW